MVTIIVMMVTPRTDADARTIAAYTHRHVGLREPDGVAVNRLRGSGNHKQSCRERGESKHFHFFLFLEGMEEETKKARFGP